MNIKGEMLNSVLHPSRNLQGKFILESLMEGNQNSNVYVHHVCTENMHKR